MRPYEPKENTKTYEIGQISGPKKLLLYLVLFFGKHRLENTKKQITIQITRGPEKPQVQF